jgi:hypothetical protein
MVINMKDLKNVSMVKLKTDCTCGTYIFGKGFWYNAKSDGNYLYVYNDLGNNNLMMNYYDVVRYVEGIKYK